MGDRDVGHRPPPIARVVAALIAIGLPAYLVSQWEHYNTQGEWMRFGRKSGKGRALISLLDTDFAKGLEVGLIRKRRVVPSAPPG